MLKQYAEKQNSKGKEWPFRTKNDFKAIDLYLQMKKMNE